MKRICPECGADNTLASIHCRNCRKKLPELSPEAMAPATAPRRSSFLRRTLIIAFLLAAGALGFWMQANLDWPGVRSGLEGNLRRLSEWWRPPPPPPPPPEPPRPNEIKIRCPRCQGVGHRVEFDNNDRNKPKKIICVLCSGNGGRTITLPPGAELCSDCGGMGKIIALVKGKEWCQACKMCEGKGYIIRKY